VVSIKLRLIYIWERTRPRPAVPIENELKDDRQRACHATWRRVRANILAVEEQ